MVILVKDVVAHILFHVDAQMAADVELEADPQLAASHKPRIPGVPVRGQKIRSLLNMFMNDTRELSRSEIIDELKAGTNDV